MADSSTNSLRIALPKGSLQEPTLKLLANAGYNVYTSSRGLRPSSNDAELDIYMIRAQEIGQYIDGGFLDCGITALENPRRLEDEIRAIPGVVGTGLFLGVADHVLVGSGNGVRELRRR